MDRMEELRQRGNAEQIWFRAICQAEELPRQAVFKLALMWFIGLLEDRSHTMPINLRRHGGAPLIAPLKRRIENADENARDWAAHSLSSQKSSHRLRNEKTPSRAIDVSQTRDSRSSSGITCSTRCTTNIRRLQVATPCLNRRALVGQRVFVAWQSSRQPTILDLSSTDLIFISAVALPTSSFIYTSFLPVSN